MQRYNNTIQTVLDGDGYFHYLHSIREKEIYDRCFYCTDYNYDHNEYIYFSATFTKEGYYNIGRLDSTENLYNLGSYYAGV